MRDEVQGLVFEPLVEDAIMNCGNLPNLLDQIKELNDLNIQLDWSCVDYLGLELGWKERWKNEGWDICVVDNKSTNTVNSLFDGVKVIESNLLDLDWKDLPRVDLILHLAAPVGPVGVLKHSGTMAQLILEDVYWVIEGAKYNNCPLVHISTSEIYGYRKDKSYLSEVGDKVLHGDYTVRNEYSIAKLLSEIVITNKAKVDFISLSLMIKSL